jgi:hypothetical protein
MKHFKYFFIILALCSQNLFARDITGRVGFGFVNNYSNQLPSLSLKYGFSRYTAFSFDLGIDSSVPTRYTFGSKFFRNLFMEPNLNFYFGFGAAALKQAIAGFELQAVLGTEIFIPGIESLGLSFEAGISSSNVNGSFHTNTIGYTFLHAGARFYF